MANVTKLTDSEFEATVQGSDTPVLVDFSATWCQPCKALAPTIEAVAKEYAGRLVVYNADIDDAGESASSLGVHSVPTCILFKGGKEVDRFAGNQDIQTVRSRIEKLM